MIIFAIKTFIYHIFEDAKPLFTNQYLIIKTFIKKTLFNDNVS